MTIMRVTVETVTIVEKVSPSGLTRLLKLPRETEFIGKVVGEDESAVLLAQGTSTDSYDNVVRIPQDHIVLAEVIDG